VGGPRGRWRRRWSGSAHSDLARTGPLRGADPEGLDLRAGLSTGDGLMGARKKYELTPEHRARLPEWRDRWIRTIMSTDAMTEEDRERCRVAVRGLYEAPNLPPPKHIVFVPSPFVLAFAGGFSAAIWHLSRTGRVPADATR